jgi:hypothetical protein
LSLLKNNHSKSSSFVDVLMMESTDLFHFDNSPAVGEMHRSSIKRSNLEIAALAFGLLAMTDNVLVGVRGFELPAPASRRRRKH